MISSRFQHRGVFVGWTMLAGEYSVVHNFNATDDDHPNGGVCIWSMERFKLNAIDRRWWVDNLEGRFGQTPYNGSQIALRAQRRVSNTTIKIATNVHTNDTNLMILYRTIEYK